MYNLILIIIEFQTNTGNNTRVINYRINIVIVLKKVSDKLGNIVADPDRFIGCPGFASLQ